MFLCYKIVPVSVIIIIELVTGLKATVFRVCTFNYIDIQIERIQ
jgi:hypothetical protein